ncbi:4-carboxymuconolactone decarboxylase [Leucoagaricus sp. SymC.cos]|nr:4-carboxymuconolactone decarboxylase [Leucoagaricus sp. SymC.cos]KXN90841.1 4-carboxymuconolactone decarboxylase [Leucoagaricus sp. SymC.cos]
MSQQTPNENVHRELYEAGEKMRRKVMGDAWVDGSAKPDNTDFMRSMQEIGTEVAWGTIWTRPGLELKQRSLINIALLTAAGKEVELRAHLRGAARNGCTEIEIQETMLQTTIYCGMPAGVSMFRIADQAIKQLKEEGYFKS